MRAYARFGKLIAYVGNLAVDDEDLITLGKSKNLRTFNVFVEGEYFEVGVDEVGGVVKAVNFKSGDFVAKGNELISIA